MSYAVRNGKVVRCSRPSVQLVGRKIVRPLSAAVVRLVGPIPDHVNLSGCDQVTLAGITIGYPGIGEQLRGDLERECARILGLHGPAAFVCTKHAAAIHEAGHVVLLAVDGLELDYAFIRQTAAGWTGMTMPKNGSWRLTSDTSPAELIRRSGHLLAGVAAEELFDADFRAGSSLDEVLVSQLLAALAADGADGRELWEQQVRGPVMRRLVERQRSLVDIAEYLLEHGRLDNADVGHLMAPPNTSLAPVRRRPAARGAASTSAKRTAIKGKHAA